MNRLDIVWRLLATLALTFSPLTSSGQDEGTIQLPPPDRDLLRSTPMRALQAVRVQRFEFEGNTVFSSPALAALLADLLDAPLDADGLEQARARLTRHYVDAGFINSGALIPDQDLDAGVVRLTIIEGAVSQLVINGNRQLSDAYLRARLTPSSPLRVGEIREKIDRLQQGGLVKKIDARLEPAPGVGQARLTMRVEEIERPYEMNISLNNHSSAPTGSYQLSASFEHRNLTGSGDTLSGSVALTRGTDEFTIGWSAPITRFDTRIHLGWERIQSEVISRPFNVLDIKSKTNRKRVGLRQPLIVSRPREVAVGVELDVTQNQTSVLGFPFSFSPGAQDGETRTSVIRLEQSWLERSPARVLALVSNVNWGIDVFDASTRAGVPDGRFLAWLGQGQWFERFSAANVELLARASFQLTNDPLVPSEKFEIGGFSTVRGYRERELVRDNAVLASLELPTPIWRLAYPGVSRGPDDGQVRLILFFDYGRGWDHSAETAPPNDISSLGLPITHKSQSA